MSAFYQWLWHLLPANPIVVRIVEGGSRRVGHLWVRMGYLGALILLMMIGLLFGGGMGQVSVTELAKAGTWVFAIVSYGQVLLVCLLAPLFMAGAISQEQSGQTYDILLTTPLSNLQIVLGSLLGRLFFVLVLLASGLPLFSVLLVFGGVPVSSIFVAFAVAALTALMVGSVAVTLAVLRRGGRKAVYAFVIGIAAYLLAVYGADQVLRASQAHAAQQAAFRAAMSGAPAQGSATHGQTTWLTGVHPVLVLESYFNSANYRPPAPEDVADYPGVVRFYLCQPLASFAILTALASGALVLWSAMRLRAIGAGEIGLLPKLWRKITGLGGNGGERRRTPRNVWINPIAWREAHTRGNRLAAVMARWGFVAASLVAAVALLLLYHKQALPQLIDPLNPGLPMDQAHTFRMILELLLLVELGIVTLVALYLSAGSVSREREDGTLDLLLTTPVSPRQYLWGKLRGLVSFLVQLLAAPLLTVALVCAYTIIGSALHWPQARPTYSVPIHGATTQLEAPLLLPEAALILPVLLAPFLACCVAIGMTWSVKAKSVLGSVTPVIAIVGVVVLVLGFCGTLFAQHVPWIGSVVNAFSPTTSLLTLIDPWEGSIDSFAEDPVSGRVILGVGAVLAAAGYALLVYSMIQRMIGSFDQSVRRLTGTGT